MPTLDEHTRCLRTNSYHTYFVAPKRVRCAASSPSLATKAIDSSSALPAAVFPGSLALLAINQPPALLVVAIPPFLAMLAPAQTPAPSNAGMTGSEPKMQRERPAEMA